MADGVEQYYNTFNVKKKKKLFRIKQFTKGSRREANARKISL